MPCFKYCQFAFPSFQRDNSSILFDSLGYSLILVFSAAFLLQTLILPQSSWAYRTLSNPVATYLGKISYMMYLVHTCVMFCVQHLGRFGAVPSRAAAFAATVAISALSWHLLESRLQNTDFSSFFVSQRLSSARDPKPGPIAEPE